VLDGGVAVADAHADDVVEMAWNHSLKILLYRAGLAAHKTFMRLIRFLQSGLAGCMLAGFASSKPAKPQTR